MVIYIIDELCPYGVRSFTKVVTLLFPLGKVG